MIYEYPEEFVVPVVYVEDLKEKSVNRKWEVEYLQVEKLIIPSEESQKDKMFKIDKYKSKDTMDKEINFLDLDEELLQEPHKKDILINSIIVEENLDNDNVKSILNNIDNDYANSETLRM